jgi:hypothetical protein
MIHMDYEHMYRSNFMRFCVWDKENDFSLFRFEVKIVIID